MSFWGRLFGSDESTGKVIDHVARGIDKLFYTDEEAASDKAQGITEGRQFLIQWLSNTQGQSLARRFIAIACTMVWLVMYCVSWIMAALSPWFTDYSLRLVESSTIVAERAESMNGAMMLILGFYFAAPHLDKIVDTAMNKFSGKK